MCAAHSQSTSTPTRDTSPMTNDNHGDDKDHSTPEISAKAKQDLALIQSSFRLAGKRVIRISTGEEPKLTLKDDGYLYVSAGSRTDHSRRLLRWHRVIYTLHRRVLPDLIDHRDGNPLNNNIENLRAATKSQNAANARNPNRPLSKTGVRNVYLLPNGKFMWQANIYGETYRRAPFDTAVAAKEDCEATRLKHFGEYHHRSKKARHKPLANTKAVKRQRNGDDDDSAK